MNTKIHTALAYVLAAACDGTATDAPSAPTTCDAAAFTGSWQPYDLPPLHDPELGGWSRNLWPVVGAPCQGLQHQFDHVDVDGDGRLDLLSSSSCAPGSELPPRVWVSIARNEGWEPTQTWKAPRPGRGEWGSQWTWVVDVDNGRITEGRYRFDLDVDGDGWRDFLFLDDTREGGIGEEYFLVHRGSAEGWGPRERWMLPEGVDWGDWDTDGSRSETVLAELGDIDGDGYVDIATSPADGDAWAEQWTMYSGAEGGWTTPGFDLDVPTAVVDLRFSPVPGAVVLYGCEEDENRTVTTFTVDLVGDPRPDIVEVSRCESDSIGVDRWRVWEGVDGGWTQDPISYALPDLEDALGEADFGRALYGGTFCYLGEEPRSVNVGFGDALGLGRPQLLSAAGCIDPDHGVDHWYVWPADEDGFRAEPLRVDLPAWPAPTEREIPWWDDPPVLSNPEATEECPVGQGTIRIATLEQGQGYTLVANFACDDLETRNERWLVDTLTCTEPREYADPAAPTDP